MKVKSVLETEFPKLKSQDGAFEFLRAEGGGNARQLCLIPIPPEGYNIPYLKDMFGPSTLVYIRPMKTSISMEKLHEPIQCVLCPQLSVLNVKKESL